MSSPLRTSSLFLGLGSLLAAGAAAGDVKVIYSEIAADPSGTVPGALDSSSLPVFTNWLAIEDIAINTDATEWVIKGRTTQATTNDSILVRGSSFTGTMFCQDGQPLKGGTVSEMYDFFDTGSPVSWNALGHIGFSCRAKGGVAANFEKVIRFDGTNHVVLHQMGDAFPGLLDIVANPTGDELFGNSIGSVTLLNDDTFLFGNTPITNCSSFRYPAAYKSTTAFKQSGVDKITVVTGVLETWDSVNYDLGEMTADGAHWLWEGDTENTSTAIDGILVVDNVCIFQEGQPLLGGPLVYADTFETRMLENGDWVARGDDSADNDWFVRNGVLLAKTGDPITTGSSENWGVTMSAVAANIDGAWLLAGNTTAIDPLKDNVIVYNGDRVIAREGDPIDLNGDGLFNDDTFINTFQAFDMHLTDDLEVYFLATLRNGAGTALGDAFLRAEVCGTATAYGTGCAGSGGITPVLSFTGCPRSGGNVTLGIDQGLGGSTALLLLGLSQVSLPMQGGCTLLVAPLPTVLNLPLSGVGPGAGQISLPATLPNGLPALTFDIQAFVIDGGVPHGFSNTNGVEVEVE